MKFTDRHILLIIVIILIIAFIFYFESTKKNISISSSESDLYLERIALNKSLNYSNRIIIETDLDRIKKKLTKYERAKELVYPDGFINSEEFSLSDYLGEKVILIDFWTYSCINCQRTLPYLTRWYQKYKDDGLLIIGVHSPEFEFEKEYDNVLKATQKWNITYPVVQDNDFQIWSVYKNRYWPRKYLIDIDGFIVYDSIGEGAYAKTEKVIQDLLKERNDVLSIDNEIDSHVVTYESEKGFSIGTTPEIYFGYEFSRNQLGNSNGWKPQFVVNYSFPFERKKHTFYLNGSWKNNAGNMELISSTGEIFIDYYAKSINLVGGSATPVNLEVFIDGEKVNDIVIEEYGLYNLFIAQNSGSYTLELKAQSGFKAYTFTFG